MAALADGLRKRMHDDLTRPADLFRMFQRGRDEDGVISTDELMRGIEGLGLAPQEEEDIRKMLYSC